LVTLRTSRLRVSSRPAEDSDHLNPLGASMTVVEFLEYLFKGSDTRDLALDLAWVYESRQASDVRRRAHG
jgi:hypothetical protein